MHRFPYNDPSRMLKWLELCPPDLTTDKGRILLCSRHFRRDQYLNINAKKPKLVHDAVPFKKRNLTDPHLPKRTEKSGKSTTINSKELSGIQPLGVNPLKKDSIEEVGNDELSSEESIEEISQEEMEESLTTVEVEMKDTDSNDSFDYVKDDLVKNILPPNQAVILENIRLKLDNEELQTELESSKQRLAFLEKQVHSLSRLTGECECVCSSCTNNSNSN